MIAAHIQDREDRKRLDLISYALTRDGVDRRNWQVAFSFEDLGPCDDCICLYGADGSWVVAYTERGQWREMGRFPASYEASNFFYAQFRPGPSLYDMREDWEAKTGQQFSMMD